VAKREMIRLLQEVVAEQPEEDRRLCDGLSSGLCLREIAGLLNISYATAKRRQARLRVRVAARLGPCW